MQCLFLFRDSAGRLPTAQELRACGFRVSNAALPQENRLEAGDADMAGGRGLALAAEPLAAYGAPPRETGPDAAGA